MAKDRYLELIEIFLEGELSEPELKEFNNILLQQPNLLADACDRLAEHRLLGLLHSTFDENDFTESVMQSIERTDAQATHSVFQASIDSSSDYERVPARTRNLNWFAGSGILTTMFLIGVSLYLWHDIANTPNQTAVIRSKKIVATLILADHCRWGEGSFAEGERLGIGPLDLKSGLAVIRFDGGAELVVRDDSLINLLSAGEVRIDRGSIIVRASDEATGFRVRTPSSELIDLGTEFSVNVGGNGETQLNVLEGEVSIRPLNGKVIQPKLLTEGHSVVVEDAVSEPKQTTHDNLRFATVIRKANPRARADLRYVYDGFFYDAGKMHISESTEGIGWKGPWRKRTMKEGYRADQDRSDFLTIAHGQMNVTWGVRGGELGMLKMPAGTTVRLREMKKAIDLSADGVYYMTLMVQEPDHSKRNLRIPPMERVRLTFRNNQNYYGESVSLGVSQELKPRIMTGQGVGFVSSSRIPTAQTTLWVGKIIARSNGEDEVYFRIFGEDEELSDDLLNWAEPSQWDIVSRNLELSEKLNLIVLTSEGLSPRYFDEIRIGPTWRSVAPLRP